MTPKVKPKGSVTEYADKEAITVTDVWNIQKNLNTTMKDHIQIATQANKKNTEALERLNESTRQRDHDHMFMSIEVDDGTDPKKFEP